MFFLRQNKFFTDKSNTFSSFFYMPGLALTMFTRYFTVKGNNFPSLYSQNKISHSCARKFVRFSPEIGGTCWIPDAVFVPEWSKFSLTRTLAHLLLPPHYHIPSFTALIPSQVILYSGGCKVTPDPGTQLFYSLYCAHRPNKHWEKVLSFVATMLETEVAEQNSLSSL